MAERKFDYQEVGEIYKRMLSTIGTAGEADSIADILDKLDKKMEDEVNVVDRAVYGDLGQQLLLDWENSSSNFPNFVSKFNNWATLIAQSAGSYSQFESDIAGFKAANPLGATSGGITDAYVNTGYYSNSYSQDEIDEMRSLAKFYQLTGATYVDTGMVSFAKKNKAFNIVTDLLNVAGIVASGFTIFNVVKSATLATTPAAAAASASSAADQAALNLASNSVSGGLAFENLGTRVAGGTVSTLTKTAQNAAVTATWYAKFGTEFAKNFVGTNVASTAFWNSISAGAKTTMLSSSVALGSGVMSQIGYAIGSNYDYSKYATGTSGGTFGGINIGETVSINSQDYTFFGATPSGTNLYSDDSGNIYYIDSNNNLNSASIVDGNGNQTPANFSGLGSSFVMKVGNETIDENVSLTGGSLDNYRVYHDEISNRVENRAATAVENDNPQKNNGNGNTPTDDPKDDEDDSDLDGSQGDDGNTEDGDSQDGESDGENGDGEEGGTLNG